MPFKVPQPPPSYKFRVSKVRVPKEEVFGSFGEKKGIALMRIN
jgi:hypothetical protein